MHLVILPFTLVHIPAGMRPVLATAMLLAFLIFSFVYISTGILHCALSILPLIHISVGVTMFYATPCKQCSLTY